MKICSIVGARPQFIKLAPFSKEVRKFHQEIIIHTGQHYDAEMSDVFFEQLELPKPDYNLGIGNGTHAEQAGKMLIEIEKVLMIEKPDLVIVFGDTNSTLAGSLAAAKQNIKSVHIEAGLRSFNRTMPEEINRIVADSICDYLFTPTILAHCNLIDIKLNSYFTGDIMVDSLEMIKSKIRQDKNNYILLTLHRPYNVDDINTLSNIIAKLSMLNEMIIFPIHPRTKKMIENNNLVLPENIIPIKPQGYVECIELQYNAKKIITDSGGIQKEAYILGVPCITIRSETEWIETVELGWNMLANPNDKDFIKKIEQFNPTGEQKNIFGSNVAKKMVQLINNFENI